MNKNKKQIRNKRGRAGAGVPGYKRINILIPESVHRRRVAEAALKGIALKNHLANIIAVA